MALGRRHGETDSRDIEADFLNAQIDEYESYANAGLTERAELVAAELRLKGHDVRPIRPTAGQKERAVEDDQLQRAVEGDESPKKRAPGRPKKAVDA